MNRPSGHSAKPSLLASDLEVIGDIRHAGTLVVQGKVTGNIRAVNLTLQQGAEVTGDVEAHQAKIEGSVEGATFVEDIVIGHGGRLVGSLQYARLVVEAGAILEADVRKMAAVEVAQADPAPADGNPADPATME